MVVVIISEAIADYRTSVVYVTGISCKISVEARVFKINSVNVVCTISNCLSSLTMWDGTRNTTSHSHHRSCISEKLFMIQTVCQKHDCISKNGVFQSLELHCATT